MTSHEENEAVEIGLRDDDEETRGGRSSDFIDDESISALAHLFRAFADPARMLLLSRLKLGPASVSELHLQSGISQGSVSKHLQILHAAGLLRRERSGHFMVYSIGDAVVFELCRLAGDKLRRDLDARLSATLDF